ncbi:MAG TPA: hypothetical protein VF668_13855, partial [Pyrinomonadaceae bacterium]
AIILTLALSLLAAAPPASRAQTAGPSAAGVYRFTLGDDFEKYLDFDAAGEAGGGASGQMYFSDEAPFTLVGDEEEGVRGAGQTYQGFFVRVAFDGMTVEGARAVMAGVVRDSNVPDFVGQRVLLTVEDNGDNTREPDRVTWGLYRPAAGGWEVSDAELREDPGAGTSWTTSDAEREDDREVVYPRPAEAVGPQTFHLSTFTFDDAVRATGDIRVSP